MGTFRFLRRGRSIRGRSQIVRRSWGRLPRRAGRTVGRGRLQVRARLRQPAAAEGPRLRPRARPRRRHPGRSRRRGPGLVAAHGPRRGGGRRRPARLGAASRTRGAGHAPAARRRARRAAVRGASGRRAGSAHGRGDRRAGRLGLRPLLMQLVLDWDGTIKLIRRVSRFRRGFMRGWSHRVNRQRSELEFDPNGGNLEQSWMQMRSVNIVRLASVGTRKRHQSRQQNQPGD